MMSKIKKLFLFVILTIVFACACTACEIPTFSTSELQPKNYTCQTCKDTKKIACKSCEGAGEKTCLVCAGAGGETCTLCDGTGSRTCTSCLGDGSTLMSMYDFFTNSYRIERRTCTLCMGQGEIRCSETNACTCAEGKVLCTDCAGEGGSACPDCAEN